MNDKIVLVILYRKAVPMRVEIDVDAVLNVLGPRALLAPKRVATALYSSIVVREVIES